MEGHLLCIKFLVSCKSNPRDILGARNDHGEMPKDLAEQFYKENVVKYIETIECEKDHPEDLESKIQYIYIYIYIYFFFFNENGKETYFG